MEPNLLRMLFGMFMGGGQGGGSTGAEMPPTPPVPFGVPSAGMPTAGVPGSASMPPVDPTTGMPTGAATMPNPAPMPARSPVPYGADAQTINSLGEALMPRPDPSAPVPRPRPQGLGAPAAPSPGYYGGSPETNPNLKPVGSPATPPQMDIQKLLAGIKPPAGPDVVKPSTPAAPQMRTPGASNLMQLLMSLGMGGKTLRGPTTLGQALENRPSAWGGLYG